MSNVDRTKLNLVLANLVYDAVADPTLRANVFSEVYDLLALRAAETDVLLKSNTTAYTPAQPNNPSTKQYVDDQITSQTVTKTNTTAFTPTADYNPSTKKYVDDQIVGQTITKTNVIPYTPSANYHPTTKKYTDDAINAAVTGVVGTPIIQTGTVFPLAPTEGQSFFKSDERRLYVYSASAWNPSNDVGSQIYAYKNLGGL